MTTLLLPLLLLAAQPAATAVAADPPRDAVHPAGMAAFVIPAEDGAMNAVLYQAAGAGPHPVLLLLHGFPGNEQNLDLAQAARRAGWSVLTLHYRGSWGSRGRFSFGGAADDAATALAFLRAPATVARYRLDPGRIAVAGHSMGGIVAARAAADDKAVLGAFLIDPWDIAAEGRRFRADPQAKDQFVREELRADLPPLAGTSEAALVGEIEAAGARLDLVLAVGALDPRTVQMVYAEHGNGAREALRVAQAAHVLPPPVLPTDHSFSDSRIALATRLVDWLGRLPR